MATIQVILLDNTQKTWVLQKNEESENKAVICDYGTGECISYDVMTLDGFEDFAAYFTGVSPTNVDLPEPLI